LKCQTSTLCEFGRVPGCEPSKVFANARTKVFANGLEKAAEFPGVFGLENSGRFTLGKPPEIMS
jgi:hypothetical protein